MIGQKCSQKDCLYQINVVVDVLNRWFVILQPTSQHFQATFFGLDCWCNHYLVAKIIMIRVSNRKDPRNENYVTKFYVLT